MGFRWRKSISKGPFRLNLSKGGVGWSFGVPGLRWGVGADGIGYLSLGIPGTGLSYVRRFGASRNASKPNKP